MWTNLTTVKLTGWQQISQRTILTSCQQRINLTGDSLLSAS